MSNTIRLKDYHNMRIEHSAAAAITPGALVELTSGNKVQNNSAADTTPAVLVALEDELQGKSIRDDYAADDPVQVWPVSPGEEVLVLITAGTDPSIGAMLQSNGDGKCKALAAGKAIFQVIGAVETDSDSNKRVPCRRV